MILSMSLILPKALEPFFEQTVYSYLQKPLDMFGRDTLEVKNDDIAYIISSKDGNTYISSDYKKILNISDYSKIIKNLFY